MKMYEIAQEVEKIDFLLENEQITDMQALELMENIEKILNEKSSGIIGYIKNKESNIDSLDNEIKRLQELKRIEKNKIDNFKKYILNGMIKSKYEKIESTLGKISIRKSESVEIIDSMKLENQYLREKISYEPDKIKIKDDIKNGCIVEGAVIKTNYSLQIK